MQGRSQDFWFGGLISAEVRAKFFKEKKKFKKIETNPAKT